MILSQVEEMVWHRRSSDGDLAEPRHHGGEIVASVETVFEFGEVAGHMLVTDGTVSASNGAFDVPGGSVDPLERGRQGGLAARSCDDRLMDARGFADAGETAQAVTDDGAGGIEIALCQGHDFGTAETLYPAQLQADWLPLRRGFERSHRGRSVHGRSCSGAFTSDEAPAQRWAFEVDAMGAMDDAVENGVGQRWIANDFMPAIDRDLAGDQQGSPVVAIIDDLEQIAALLGIERFRCTIVDDQQAGALERAPQARQPALGARRAKIGEQARGALGEHRKTLAACLVAERA